ncbi:MAG: hypothetical protein WCK27_00715 [Verrucomicrobiota bacterium]
MRFDTNLLKNRAIVNVSDESFGITFTHWTRKRRSWSVQWRDVIAIEAMVVEVPCFEAGFVFQLAEKKECFISDDMENWGALEEAVRKRFTDFNWSNADVAKLYENRNKRLPCWKRVK